MSYLDQVRARVVNISSPTATVPERLVLDTNVLHWVFYDNLEALEAAHDGGRILSAHQRTYKPWLKPALPDQRVKLFTSLVSIMELVNTTEVAELQLRWMSDPQRRNVGWDERRGKKQARRELFDELADMRHAALTYVKATRKVVEVLPMSDVSASFRRGCEVWRSSSTDLGDAMLVAAAQQLNLTALLTDDADLATVEGLTVYTANPQLIQTARQAGRLQ